MFIQVLGTGCAKCIKLAAQAEEAAKMAGVDFTLEKVIGIVKVFENNCNFFFVSHNGTAALRKVSSFSRPWCLSVRKKWNYIITVLSKFMLPVETVF